MSDNPPLVSVIIPTYNRGWIVSEAIDSVLRQDYPNVELIVVDDGSTDRTDSILSDYADRLKMIRQTRQGVSAARNRGIDASAGELIAFLDSDDYWLDRKLSVQVAYLRQHPRLDVCQTEEIWIRNGVRVNPGKRHRKPSGDIFVASLKRCLVSPSAVMLRRTVFDRCGNFDRALPACEDYDLWLRIGCRMPVHLIDRPLIVKRGGHTDQLSRQPSLDKYRIQALVKLLSGDLLTPYQRSAAIDVLGAKCRIYIDGCLKRGRIAEAGTYQALAGRFGLRF